MKKSKGEQEVRAGWELKEKKSRGEQEVIAAGNAKRRIVDGNKK